LARAVEHGWNRAFGDPILVSFGRKLVTLKDASDYIMKLPEAVHEARGVAGRHGKL